MTIYTMQHDTIKFSSVNQKQVEYYESLFSGVTETDIKENPSADRHANIIGAGLAGDFPLFDEYMRARGIKQKAYDNFMASYDNYATKVTYNGFDMLIWDAAEKYSVNYTYEKTGWVL
jgi:hypothetical protein